MNIKMQVCGIILLLVILYFYSRRNKIRLNTQTAFIRMSVTTMAALFLDILSLVGLAHHETWSVFLVNLICKSYLASLVLCGFSGLVYTCADVYKVKKRYHFQNRIMAAIALVGIVLVYILPISKFVEDPEQMYTYGPSVICTYLFCFGFLFGNTFLLIMHKSEMNIRRWEAVRTWMVIWIGAALIQFFNNKLLLIGYAGAIGVMIIYLKLENPELNLDHKSGLFNRAALILYTNQLYGRGEEFAILGVVIPQFVSIHSVASFDRLARQEINRYFMDIPGSYAFKGEEDEIILVFQSKERAEYYRGILKSRFEFGWGENGEVFLNPSFIYMPHTDVVNTSEDILHLIGHARQNEGKYIVEDTFVLNKDVVFDMYEEKRVENLLQTAMDKDWVEVFYQPIFSTKQQGFVAAEALVRIRDESGKVIPPGMFIGVAEKNGMILKLGEIIFEKVCRFIRDEKPERYGIHYIEINLSVIQCGYEHLADNYIRVMKKYQIDPDMINLEITESASLDEKETLLDNMKELINYGVKFSLDDFGTGQSNLNYIVDMPVDIVKFDRSMILSYFENGKAKYVMDAAMHMIHGMELQIVSEGIETEEQYDVMKDLGISYIQGYYFSKPLPEKEFLEFLSQQSEQEQLSEA